MKKIYLGFSQKTQIRRIATEEGKSIEEQLREATATNTPIESVAPMIYTEKAQGVLPETDMRTDRQELALGATSKFDKSERAKVEGVEEGNTTNNKQNNNE